MPLMRTFREACLQFAIACAASAVASTAAHAQKPETLLSLADGRKIYVLGLRQWTVGMIQDSLAKYSPTDSLQSHACAAVLRYKLGFADAAAVTLRMGRDQPDIVFVSVREPQDSARVRYRDMPLDTAAAIPEWRSVTDVMTKRPGVFRTGAGVFLSPPSDRRPSFANSADSAQAIGVATFLLSRSSDADYRKALDVLARSPNMYNRSVAALILTNFADRDGAWQALVEALRESDGPVKGFARDALYANSRRSRTPKDWTRMASAVHAILDGTSLFQLEPLAEVLIDRPEIGPQHASAFLRNGGEMLLNYLASEQPTLSRPARRLLIKLHGSDLGTDVAAWRRWVAGL